MDSPAPNTAPNTAPETAPRILENLVAAGLVSHEMIGDPARVPTESAALAALCARVAGPVYRLGAYHYAFRAGPEDLGGTLAEVEPGAWAAAMEAALTGELGEEAVWINAADLAAEAEAGLDATEILFLKAAGDATAAALDAAPELSAVVHAGLVARGAAAAAEATAAAVARAAAEAARAAGGEAAAVAGAVGALSARVEALEARVEARIESGIKDALGRAVEGPLRALLAEAVAAAKTPDPLIERVAATFAAFAERLQAQAVQLDDQSGRQDALASGIAALETAVGTAVGRLAAAEAAQGAALAAFESRLGLTLAEFLAQTAPLPAARIVETAPAEAARPRALPAAQVG